MYKSRLLFLSILIIALFKVGVCQETSTNSGVGAVAEIIVPAQTNMQSNFNLFYQVKFSRKDIPIPSFWYKVVFGDTCSFQFSLFPLNENDKYDFYLYKIKNNLNFCAALGEGIITSCDSNKIKANSTELGIKAGLVKVSPIKVQSGDAIYLEVLSTKGWDRGHMLDFRLSDSSSFIVKVENEFRDTSRNETNENDIAKEFKEISDKDIQDVFCKTLSAAETEPYHLLYTKEQALKDSIAFANSQKNKAANNTIDIEKSKSKVKPNSTVAIFNAIKDKPLSKAKNPVYLENYIPEEGLIYKIQVGFFMEQTPSIQTFKGLSPVFQEKLPSGIKYSVGAFTKYELASIGKNFVKSLELEDAFIIAYYNGKRVTIAEALNYESK